MRIGEAMAMRVSDIEARDRSPRLGVYGKGGRWRVVPVGPEVVEAVADYLLSRSERFGPHSPRGSGSIGAITNVYGTGRV